MGGDKLEERGRVWAWLNSRQHVIWKVGSAVTVDLVFPLKPVLDLSFSNNGDKRHECRDHIPDVFRSDFVGHCQDRLRADDIRCGKH